MQTEAVTVAVQIGEFDFKFAVFKFLVNVMTGRNRVAMGCQARPRRNALEIRLEAFTSSQLQIYSEDIAGARSRLQMI
jgi:hypothetical protein